MKYGKAGLLAFVSAFALAACFSPLEAGAANILIENVTLIDGTGSAPLPGASVLVKGDRIEMISAGPLKHEAGVEIINGKGKFLIPGLMDTHIHLSGGRLVKDGKPATDPQMGIRALQGYLYCGVTSVYDAANNEDYIFALRDQERAGKIVSPRIFATGALIAAPGGYASSQYSINISDWDDAKPKLEAQFARKPDLQKIALESFSIAADEAPKPIPTLSEELLAKVIRFANENGIRTTVHISLEPDATKALDAGIDDFAHPVYQTASEGFLRAVATKKIPVNTTLAVFSYIAQIGDDASFLDEPLWKASVDPEILNAQKTTDRKRYIDSGMSAKFKANADFMPQNVKHIYDMGGILALGTDRTWGPTVHMELALLHKAGIPLLDVLKIATLNGAIYLGREKDMGSIERGKLADMVLLKADPTKDVKNFQTIDAVYKGGEKINMAALDIPVNRK